MAWVAKNKDGSETIYEVKPYKRNDEWVSRKDGWERPCLLYTSDAADE